MHYPIRGENTQMWVVWSLRCIGWLLLGFVVVRDGAGGKLEADQGRGPEMGCAAAVLLALDVGGCSRIDSGGR